eukprot:TRINITY_DN107387_c0_g1_i1.p1 TRINITY_DN107387_c0_g1~~TRINITY_DN107387_c0_g1_i1.p1  ORF type:complete len:232 (-),score=35.13 TRINITY_DN107387_c0_g1_i1:73-729(-)
MNVAVIHFIGAALLIAFSISPSSVMKRSSSDADRETASAADAAGEGQRQLVAPSIEASLAAERGPVLSNPGEEGITRPALDSVGATASVLVAAAVGSERPARPQPRPISAEEVKRHSTPGDFWAVIDGYVVDASDFISKHPGGVDKIMSANNASTGASGQPFGFSFTRGRNAHFPETGKRFKACVKKYLEGGSDDGFLPATEVALPPSTLVLLGRLEG